MTVSGDRDPNTLLSQSLSARLTCAQTAIATATIPPDAAAIIMLTAMVDGIP